MIKLFDLFDDQLFSEMLAEGMAKRTDHPTLPLSILNYTPKAAYSRTWNEVTRQCRGLIYRQDSLEVLARPFPKFFNLGELADDEIPQEPFEVFEKMDGSLGILYAYRDVVAIATRGSFTSDQAVRATMIYHDRYNQRWTPTPRTTYLFEIIYPSNRIVVDYGGMEDLVLLDVVSNRTGRSCGPTGQGWPGPVVAAYEGYEEISDLAAAPQPDNAEGYVIRFAGGMRVKVKHDEYVRLHRIVTGVSTKTVWRYLKDGLSMDELLDRVPDEFFDWLTAETRKLRDAYSAIEREAQAVYAGIMRDLDGWYGIGSREFRKDFAMRAQQSEHRAILFQMLDGKVYSDAIWKQLEPAYERPFNQQSEDVA